MAGVHSTGTEPRVLSVAMTRGPIIFVTGAPGAGKSTLCSALATCFERAVLVPVDDLREWVVSGNTSSLAWSDETERQFQLAEASTCALAKVYSEGGFAVLVDHCRNLDRLDKVVMEHLDGWPVLRVCLRPSLETALHRNATRTNKDFDTALLEPIIRHVVEHNFNQEEREGWLMVDNTSSTVDACVDRVVSVLKESK